MSSNDWRMRLQDAPVMPKAERLQAGDVVLDHNYGRECVVLAATEKRALVVVVMKSKSRRTGTQRYQVRSRPRGDLRAAASRSLGGSAFAIRHAAAGLEWAGVRVHGFRADGFKNGNVAETVKHLRACRIARNIERWVDGCRARSEVRS